MRTSGATFLASWILCVGCGNSAGPDGWVDHYALIEVGGDPIPVRVADETWLADTIRLGSLGKWSRVEVVVLHTEGSSPDPVRRFSDGFITRKGERIVLDFTCPPNANCVAPDTVRRTDHGLVRRRNTYGDATEPDPEFRYLRIP